MNVQYTQAELRASGKTAIWGNAVQDGQILSKEFDISLHVINIDKKGTII